MSFWSKFRPNVIVLSVLLTGLSFYFGMELFNILEITNTAVAGEILALLLGLSLGCLGSIAVQCFNNPPPPTIEESTLLGMIDRGAFITKK